MLLLLTALSVHAQGQLINGNRTIAGAFNYCLAGGTANTLTCTLNPSITTYRPGTCFLIKAASANTGAATLNVNGLGAKAIKKAMAGVQTDLAANDLGIGQLLEACYDGTNMQAQSLGSAGGGSGSGVVSSGTTAALAAYLAAGTTVAPSTALTINATAILSANPNVSALASNTTLGAHNVVACTSGASTVSLTLPGAAASTVGTYRVIKVDAGTGQCVVQPATGERLNATVDATRAVSLLNDELEITLASRTTPNWHVAIRRSLWDLGTDVTGNLAISRLNNGTNASASTVWCGNGTWCTPAGGGNLSNTGTPVAGQTAEFASQTTLQGVATTGTGNYVKQTSPTLIAPVVAGVWNVDSNGRLGLGVTANTLLHLLGPSAEIRQAGSATNQTLSHTLYDNNSTAKGSLSYQGGDGAGSRYISLLSVGADGVDLRAFNDVPVFLRTNNLERGRVTSSAFTIGFNGVTNPAFRVNYSAGSVDTGLDVTGQATGNPTVLTAIGSAADVGVDLNAKGSGNLRLQTVSTGGVLFGGAAPRTVGMERNTTSNTAGQPWTAPGGSATSGSTNKDAGGIIFQTGLSTGTGRGVLRFQGTTTAGSTGTSDNVHVDKMILGGYKTLANNVTTTVANLTVASNTGASIMLAYGAHVFNGTDVQLEEGWVVCHAINKASVIATETARCSQVGNIKDSSLATATLVVTFTVTTAGDIQVNVNSSLNSISTGYPKLQLTTLMNTGSQAVVLP
jgi:hypothetical protein